LAFHSNRKTIVKNKDCSFDSEKQNEPTDPQQCLFKEETFKCWDDEFNDVQHLIKTIDYKCRFYGACDPSLGRTTGGDYTAIIALLKDKDSKVNYVIAADLLHCSPSEALDRITEYIRMYDFEYFAIETNNFQQLMANEIEERISQIRSGTSIFEIKSVSNKRSRIAGLEPYISQGRLRFCRQHRQLLEQLKHFPLAKNDDGPDALEMAVEASKEEGAKWYRFTP
jgi:predicted phage terminase large subunit-like protein